MVNSGRFRLGREVSGADDACKASEKFHNLDCSLIEMIQMGVAALFVCVREIQTDELVRKI